MEIWTEDSGAGYIYWKCINKYIFNNAFRVVACKGNRDILFKLEKEHSDKLIIIIVDKMIDNEYTAETYNNIRNEISKHKNICMPIYSCTERCFLTYKNIDAITGYRNRNSMTLKDILLTNSEVCGIIDNNIIQKYIGNKTSESVYKSILASITNGTHAFIGGNKLGGCWIVDCCMYPIQSCRLISKIGKQKVHYIVRDSEFIITINDIYKYISEFILNKYKYFESDLKYKEYMHIQVGNNTNKIAFMACKYLEETKSIYWSYERLYRRYFK